MTDDSNDPQPSMDAAALPRAPDPTPAPADGADLDGLLRAGATSMGIDLSDRQAEQLVGYLRALLEENTRMNLTGVKDPAEAVTRHLLDSLSVAPAWCAVAGEHPPARMLDLGTGGGFPGVPLAVLWPGTRVLLVDGTAKKLAAVERCLEGLGLPNVETLHSRGKDVARQRSDTRGALDLCVARAVGQSEKLLRELPELVRPGGWVFLMKGPRVPDPERTKAAWMAPKLGFKVQKAQVAEVPGLHPRTILVYRKT